MDIILIWISALSFFGYGMSCLFTRHMKLEFKRFGLASQRLFVGWTQVLGATGLLLGIQAPAIGLIAAGGLAFQMLLGVGVRIAIRDTFLQTLPASVYFLLNLYLFIAFL